MNYHPTQRFYGLQGSDEESASVKKSGVVVLGLAAAIFIGIVALGVNRLTKEEQKAFREHLSRARKTYGGKTGKVPADIEREIFKLYKQPLPARLRATGLGF